MCVRLPGIKRSLYSLIIPKLLPASRVSYPFSAVLYGSSVPFILLSVSTIYGIKARTHDYGFMYDYRVHLTISHVWTKVGFHKVKGWVKSHSSPIELDIARLESIIMGSCFYTIDCQICVYFCLNTLINVLQMRSQMRSGSSLTAQLTRCGLRAWTPLWTTTRFSLSSMESVSPCLNRSSHFPKSLEHLQTSNTNENFWCIHFV